jgi:hypothetical protein
MKKISFALLLYCCASLCTAQNVGIGTTTPNASAMLDISSNNKGLLMPRMTSAQRKAIVAPSKGLMAFDNSSNSFWYYTGTSWKELAGNSYNNDSALVLGKQSGSISTHNITSYSSSFDSSGYLYDSGGPLGNYGNNENFVYSIGQANPNQLATDIIVMSNNIEGVYDSLIISDYYGHRYVLMGATTGTYRFYGDVKIQFKSNFTINAAGFAIRWNGVFPGISNYDPNQTTGWYYNPAKNYMRGGVNANNNWSPDSSGLLSFAYGYDSKAKGNYSVAFGNHSIANYGSFAAGVNAIASGEFSFATGDQSIATGNYSVSIGESNTANNDGSVAIGTLNRSTGGYSTAIGYSSVSNGEFSTAIGFNANADSHASTALGNYTISRGESSTSMGTYTVASGDYSTATGLSTNSKSYGGFVTGLYNDSSNAASSSSINSLNRIFQIGNGTADYALSNAMTVLQNGNVGINTTTPQSTLQVNNGAVLFDGTTGTTPLNGAGTRLMWIPVKAAFRAGNVLGSEWDDINIGNNSFAGGNTTTASADNCTALGNWTKASGWSSTTLGQSTIASGYVSTAMGNLNKATGGVSTAMGAVTTASGDASTATGYFTKSKSFAGFVTGQFNDSTNASSATSSHSLNRIFQIGNGTTDATRNNAMTVLQNGNTGINTTNPTSKLDVNGQIAIDQKNFGGYAGLLIKGNSPVSNYPNIGFSTQNNAAADIIAAGIGAAINNNTAGAEAMDLSFYTSTTGLAGLTERVRIKDNGNVGIGEINPTVPLNFAASLGNKISLWGTDANHYGMGIQSFLMQFYSANYSDDIAFGYGNSAAFTENVRIKGNGNVGIGTNKPGAMLTVKKDINVDNGDGNAGTTDNTLKFGGDGSGEAIGSNRTTATNQYGLDFYTLGANRMSITLGGNVGIGTTGPTAKLSVNGNANNSTGSWGVFSDERVKTVTGNFTDGLNVIRQINPVVFNYNDNAPFKTSDDQIGIVAQELEKIAPYMVSKQAYNQFEDLREVNNQAYVFLLINAVKEQQEQITNQQQQIESQQKENTLLQLQVVAQQKESKEQKERMDSLEKLVKVLSKKVN